MEELKKMMIRILEEMLARPLTEQEEEYVMRRQKTYFMIMERAFHSQAKEILKEWGSLV